MQNKLIISTLMLAFLATGCATEVKSNQGVMQKITGLKRGTLQSKVCLKQIPHTRLGGRLVVFSRAELEAWMRERAVPVKAVP